MSKKISQTESIEVPIEIAQEVKLISDCLFRFDYVHPSGKEKIVAAKC